MHDTFGKPVGQLQATLNGSTRGQWTLFDSHRREIERLLGQVLPERDPLLLAASPVKPKLCVLGAGNCNDLDLRWLIERFSEVHLFDIDAEALRRATTRQNVTAEPAVVSHAPVDLSGLTTTLDRWLLAPPTDGDIEAAVQIAAQTPLPATPGTFDVVVSPCLLSQLIAPVRQRIEKRAGWQRLRKTIITRHLAMLMELVRPGGHALFLCDVVSSDTEPQLPQASPEKLEDVLQNLADRGRTFRDLDPRAIIDTLRQHPRLAEMICQLKRTTPWLWHLGPRRTYLVYALLLRKREAC
jgi:hypothetical protein